MKTKNLIFLHGFPFNGSSWDPQVEYFKNKYDVLAPDLRGHRNGPYEAGAWMIAHFADDLKHLMVENKIDKAVICGLSMGGYIALHFAEQYPEMVAGLILCDTQAGADSNEVKDKRYITIQKIQNEGLSHFAQDFSKAALSETTLKEKPEIQKSLAAMINENNVENITKTLAALASRRDSSVYLSAFSFPVMVLVGADDKITPPAMAQKISEGINNCTLHMIEEAGHMSNLEQPAIFNQYIETFMEKI